MYEDETSPLMFRPTKTHRNTNNTTVRTAPFTRPQATRTSSESSDTHLSPAWFLIQNTLPDTLKPRHLLQNPANLKGWSHTAKHCTAHHKHSFDKHDPPMRCHSLPATHYYFDPLWLRAFTPNIIWTSFLKYGKKLFICKSTFAYSQSSRTWSGLIHQTDCGEHSTRTCRHRPSLLHLHLRNDGGAV